MSYKNILIYYIGFINQYCKPHVILQKSVLDCDWEEKVRLGSCFLVY